MLAAKTAAGTRASIRLPAFLLALTAVAGCVYFNALYNANRLFDEGRKDIEGGAEARGRATLQQSIDKAERVIARNPNSRWADDAVRLVARARALREEWPETATASRRLLSYAKARSDSAEAAGLLGMAELHIGSPVVADSLLSVALADAKDQRDRAVLHLSRAEARLAQGLLLPADSDYLAAEQYRPAWIGPRLGRARALTEADRGDEAVSELHTVLAFRLPEPDQEEVVELAHFLAERAPTSAVMGLQEVESSELSAAARSELLTLRGDLHRSRGATEAARRDYQLAQRTGAQTRSAVGAYLAAVRLELDLLTAPEALAPVREMLDAAMLQPPGPGGLDARRMAQDLARVEYWVGLGNLGWLAAAEAARDDLDAPRLARTLFLRYAREQPEGLWAPKALLAALDLTDLDSDRGDGMAPNEPSADELRRRLREDYSASAYVQVLVGGSGAEFTYEELELGLRRQLERLAILADQHLNRGRRPVSQP